jgi:hypothetical protein
MNHKRLLTKVSQAAKPMKKSFDRASEGWHRRRLERRIEKLLFAALGHKDAGAEIGDRTYRLLYTEALQLADLHQQRHNVDPVRLRAHLPSLHHLEKLAQPEEPLF